jgi:hypothetical protein
VLCASVTLGVRRAGFAYAYLVVTHCLYRAFLSTFLMFRKHLA